MHGPLSLPRVHALSNQRGSPSCCHVFEFQHFPGAYILFPPCIFSPHWQYPPPPPHTHTAGPALGADQVIPTAPTPPTLPLFLRANIIIHLHPPPAPPPPPLSPPLQSNASESVPPLQLSPPLMNCLLPLHANRKTASTEKLIVKHARADTVHTRAVVGGTVLSKVSAFSTGIYTRGCHWFLRLLA
jgi:hypothetical protein